MSDTTAAQSRLEAFFRKRSGDPEGVRVVGYEPILGGYSRAMARVWVEDSSGRRGYVVRADPPPGQSIIDTDRSQEWALLSALHGSGAIPLPAPLWFDETGDELGSPAIVMEMVEAESLLAKGRQATDPSVFAEFDRKLSEVASAIHTFDLDALPSHLDGAGVVGRLHRRQDPALGRRRTQVSVRQPDRCASSPRGCGRTSHLRLRSRSSTATSRAPTS